MNPSVEDRLNSVIRAIGGVILPALPESASLAREQAMLAMGHIQIILAQLPLTAAFESEEAADMRTLAATVARLAMGGTRTQAACASLMAAISNADALGPNAQPACVQDAIDALLLALAADGDRASSQAVSDAILAQGAERARKDRQWFAAMGFDSEFSTG